MISRNNRCNKSLIFPVYLSIGDFFLEFCISEVRVNHTSAGVEWIWSSQQTMTSFDVSYSCICIRDIVQLLALFRLRLRPMFILFYHVIISAILLITDMRLTIVDPQDNDEQHWTYLMTIMTVTFRWCSYYTVRLNTAIGMTHTTIIIAVRLWFFKITPDIHEFSRD